MYGTNAPNYPHIIRPSLLVCSQCVIYGLIITLDGATFCSRISLSLLDSLMAL